MKFRTLKYALLLLAPLTATAFTTSEQLILKDLILAEPSIQQCVLNGQDQCVANWLNTPSTFVVWRTSVSAEEYHNGAIVWTAVDGLTAGKARIWDWMSRYGSINPSKPNVRQGFSDAFGAASATTTAAVAISKRNATQAEKVFATGTGTTATPALLTFEGFVTETDVVQILRGAQ